MVFLPLTLPVYPVVIPVMIPGVIPVVIQVVTLLLCQILGLGEANCSSKQPTLARDILDNRHRWQAELSIKHMETCPKGPATPTPNELFADTNKQADFEINSNFG